MDATTDEPQGSVDPRVIKRYANRKLYDTRDSRYVTLQQIAEYVRAGEEVRILDNRTKEDLTNVTLAQIIYEEEKKGDETRSVRSLRNFIQQGRNRIEVGRERLMASLREGPVGKLVSRRDEDGLEVGEVDTPEAEAEPVKAAPETRASDIEALKSVVKSPKEAFDELSRLADDRVKALIGGAMSHVEQLQSEVKRLQGRIEELEGRLSSLGRRTKKGEEEPEQDG